MVVICVSSYLSVGELVRPAVPRAGGRLSADCRPTAPAADRGGACAGGQSEPEPGRECIEIYPASKFIRSVVGTSAVPPPLFRRCPSTEDDTTQRQPQRSSGLGDPARAAHKMSRCDIKKLSLHGLAAEHAYARS